MDKIKAGLARVSTDKQQYDVALSNQIQRLRSAGSALGLDDCGRRKFGATLPQDQWDIRRDTHPDSALLTESDYMNFKAIVEINGRARPNTRHWIAGGNLRYAISGLVYCGECGGKCGANGTKKHKGIVHSYYKCRNAMTHKSCPQTQTVRNDRIESAIITAITSAATELERFTKTPIEPNITPPSPELVKLRDQLAGLMALGQSSIIAGAIEEIKLQINRMEFTEKCEVTETKQIKEDLLTAFLDKDFWEFALAETQLKTKLFNQFIDRVIIRDGAIVKVLLKL